MARRLLPGAVVVVDLQQIAKAALSHGIPMVLLPHTADQP
jgi:hypothetical protein